VDDEPTIIEAVKELLEALSYNILTAFHTGYDNAS
jgi:hypothetical protein